MNGESEWDLKAIVALLKILSLLSLAHTKENNVNQFSSWV
jgi:hypothetical protein